MRDDFWLKQRLDAIWSLLFPDVEKRNHVIIRFKGKWKNKFGHIKRLRNKDSEIAINGLFRNDVIPEFVIDVTIAHELVHYMHGFNSPHPKMFSHPHRGGIVDKELKRRGFTNNLMLEKKWTKETWPEMWKKFGRPRKQLQVIRLKFW